MSKHEENLWQGIDRGARDRLNTRDYRTASFTQELSQQGLDAGELAAANRSQREINDAWIPGVEIFARKVYPQRHRGLFGEFVRRDEGILARIGLWPKLRGCFRELPRAFTCIHPAFRKIVIQ